MLDNMIGTSIIAKHSVISEREKAILLKEEWHYIDTIYMSDSISVFASTYRGYPICKWENEDNIFILEGCIYNKADDTLYSEIEDITKSGQVNQNNLLRFIESSDGDYIVYIINKLTKDVIVFNDILGGVPVYYIVDRGRLAISRSYSLLCSLEEKIEWDKQSLVEFIALSYNLGSNTFLPNIKRMKPAQCVVYNYNKDTTLYSLEIIDVYKETFEKINPYKTKKEAVKDLAKLFDQACRSRVEYAQHKGYKIINTLSGGFDSRTILGGIEKCTSDYTNLTYEYNRDESVVAKKVLDVIGSKSNYLKMSFRNEPKLKNPRYTYNTDGKINIYTNSVCYNDVLQVKKTLGSEPIFYFGGFGGEFIRHPYYDRKLSAKKYGDFIKPSYKTIASILNVRHIDAINHFNDTYLESRVGQQKDNFYLWLYNEYYQNLVRCSGEDRTRMFFYTVQPMMAKDFIMAIRHRVPLHWAGFEFYVDFLNELDLRLSSIEVYGKDLSFMKKENLSRLDSKERIKASLTWVKYLLNKFPFYEKCKTYNQAVDYTYVKDLLAQAPNKDLFNNDKLESNYKYLPPFVQYRIVGILQYLSTVETKNVKNNY